MVNYRYIRYLVSNYCFTYEMYVAKKLDREKYRAMDLSAFDADELGEWSSRKCLECDAVATAFYSNLKALFDARRTFRKLEKANVSLRPLVNQVYEFYLNQGA